ncbi:hypothetical protein NXZ75_13595 [Lysinibacillus sphaericus]|uniref:hypothetical protein n=1 Tax=Lysinibacillus sphaericus TaxID=1421 RepID=UPI0021632D17|nr:hypothetical protein [Lysinibacillus sphaericus]MCS1383235.1 hypothetical protein [Lysinibacillus sphaericus]
MESSKTIINRDKKGRIIKDLTKVTLPQELEVSIFKILNPDLPIKEVKFVS